MAKAMRTSKHLWIVALLIGSTVLANAFSLLGPLSTPATTWQVQGIGFSLPGGLTLYWLTMSLLTVAQQWLILRKMPPKIEPQLG